MHPNVQGFVVADFIRVVRQHRRRFFVSAATVAVFAALYAIGRSNTWEAAQALIVRNEAAARSAQERPGRFDRPEQMQTLQETVLELARSRSVLQETLQSVSSPNGMSAGVAPTDREIERLRSAVRVTPPKGAEFGKTEIFYLNVKDSDRERAVQLAATLCGKLKSHYQKLRDEKAKSMIDELARTVTLASDDVKTATVRLAKVEAGLGADLAELRILEKSPSGGSDLRTQLSAIESELRDARTAVRTNQALRELLVSSTKDTGQLLAAPNRLLESQPALKRLKEGVVDAQLRTAQLRGSMTENHPKVTAAVAAEEDIRHSLTNELATALRGIDVDLRLTNSRVQVLTSQLDDLHKRLEKLAGTRAEYGNLVEEIQNRQQILKSAQENLADARASQAAARSASLISAIDVPDTGSSPIGPGRLTILFCGVVGGVAVGLGVVLLTAGPGQTGQSATGTTLPSPAQRTSSAPASGVSLKEVLTRIGRRRPSWN